MLNVLIVDDEESICKLIHYLVPWTELDMQVVNMLHNGNEAIEVLRQKKIDILISDARMPGCDGIELIKWCKDNQPELKCIIISGFRHFEYAHGAMKYGAVDYLLKPIKKEELVEILRRISDSIQFEKKEEEKKMDLQKIININKDNLKRHFINSYIFDGNHVVKDNEIIEHDVNEQFKMNFQKGVYQTVFFKLDDISKMHKELEQLMIKMEEIIECELQSYCTEYAGTKTHTGLIYLINYAIEKTADFIPFIQKMSELLEKQVDLFEQIKLTIGIGSRKMDIKYISECMFTAGCAIKYRIANQNVFILEYDRFLYNEVDISTILTAEIQEIIKNNLKTGNKDGIRRCIQKTKSDISSVKNFSPVSLFEFANCFGILLREYMEQIVGKEQKYLQPFIQYNQEIDYAISEDELWKVLEQFGYSCIDYIQNEMKCMVIRPLRLAMEYIALHFMEPITLDAVAEAVMLSPNYLSKIFKNETGTNFSEYLILKRMEKASELLRNTDESISIIAEQVGYSDLKYFRKLCKKYIGLKPSEYRKLYS